MTRLRLLTSLSIGLIGLCFLGGTTVATAATAPASMSLSAVPETVTWPDQTNFNYRLEATAGPEGANFEFAPIWSDWKLPGVFGNPWFVDTDAVLDGPGQLSRASALIVDPLPTACFRGGMQSMLQYWRLTIPPGETTTVSMPARLGAARLAGMNTEMKVQVSDPAEGQTLTAPLDIQGPEGLRIVVETLSRKVKLGQKLVLSGQTMPAVKNRQIQISAEPRMWSGNGPPPKPNVTFMARTDGQGKFKSQPVSLDGEATWVLTSRVLDPAPFDGAASCNGTVEVTDGWYQPSWIDLEGSRFVSTKIIGRNLGQRKIFNRDGSLRAKKKNRLTLSFSLSRRFSPEIPNRRDWPRVPHLSPHTGCNRMGGEVTVEKGLIRSTRGLSTTLMACRPNHDGWARKLFSKGMRAAMKGEKLVLKRGKTKVVFKRSS